MILVPRTDKQVFNKKELFAYVRSFGFRIDDSLLEEFQKQGVMPHTSSEDGQHLLALGPGGPLRLSGQDSKMYFARRVALGSVW